MGGSENTSEFLTQCKDHDDIHRLQLTWHALVFAVGLPLNLVALWIFLRVLRLRTVVTVYMTNLAVCDLFFTLALPFRLYYYATDAWPLGDVPCQLAGSLFQLNMYGSCIFLAAINVDRFLALVHPLRSRPLRRPKTAWKVCWTVWGLIVLGSIPVALAHDTSRCLGANSSVEVRCFESFSGKAWRRELLPLIGLAEVLGFILPLSAVVYCSVRILRILGRGGEPGDGTRRRAKVRLLLLSSAGIFILCFMPYNLLLAAYAISKVTAASQHSVAKLRYALQVSMLLSSSNCCLDPLIYYFSTEGFRATFRSKPLNPGSPSGSGKGRWTQLTSRKSKRKGRKASGPGPLPPAVGELPLGELPGDGEGGEGEGDRL